MEVSRRSFIFSGLSAGAMVLGHKIPDIAVPHLCLNLFSAAYFEGKSEGVAKKMYDINNRLIVYADQRHWRNLGVAVDDEHVGDLVNPEDYAVTNIGLDHHERVIDVDLTDLDTQKSVGDKTARIPSRMELLNFAIEKEDEAKHKTKRFNPEYDKRPMRGRTSFNYQGIRYNIYDLIDFVV